MIRSFNKVNLVEMKQSVDMLYNEWDLGKISSRSKGKICTWIYLFEILEETEMKPEMDRREFKKYLNEMAEKYTENMDPEELY